MPRKVDEPKKPAKKPAKKTPKKAATKKAAKRPAKKAAAKAAERWKGDVAGEAPGAAEVVVPEVVDPPYDAHRLRLTGMPWREVAQRTGYGSTTAAMNAVSTYLQRAAAAQSAQRQQEALQTAIDRYEALLAAWWEKGTVELSEKAALVLLRTMSQLDRIQRLGESEITVTQRTIVISANPEEYVAQLQQVVEGGHPAVEGGPQVDQ